MGAVSPESALQVAPGAGAAPLLGGPYTPPPLRRGQRVTCLYRDGECVVTGWSDAPIPWPRCRALGHRGGSGLLFTPELVRAVRTESCEALAHWFAVSHATASRWRAWAGVPGHTATPGSRRAHLLLSLAGAQAVRAREWTAQERDARRAAARQSRQGRRGPRDWTPEQDALLGTVPDAVVAARTGRTVAAVRCRRWKLCVSPVAPGAPEAAAD